MDGMNDQVADFELPRKFYHLGLLETGLLATKNAGIPFWALSLTETFDPDIKKVFVVCQQEINLHKLRPFG
jgi:hypothetical protein